MRQTVTASFLCKIKGIRCPQSKTQVSQPLVFMLKLGELIWKKENKNEP
ncbi:hypothetical protein B1P84_13865 [Enterococcus faecium]|nr:hypothetical protein B1P84_13865 [Enterococcus faecium]